MCNKAVDNYPHALVPECHKTQKKCVIKLLIDILLIQNMFLNVVRLEKCVIKQFIDVLLYLIVFLINIKLKKYMT